MPTAQPVTTAPAAGRLSAADDDRARCRATTATTAAISGSSVAPKAVTNRIAAEDPHAEGPGTR